MVETPDLGPELMNITCGGCQFTGDVNEFTSTPLNGPLPPLHFQCPKCCRAWRVEKSKWETKIGANGQTYRYETGRNKIVPIQSTL